MDAATRIARTKELQPKWNEAFLQIAALIRKNHIRVLLIKKPESNEIVDRSYMCNFDFFDVMADTISGFKRYDLLPYYSDSAHICKTNVKYYYWLHDGHHNSMGYEVMAKAVLNGLLKSYPEIFSKLDSTKAKE